MKDRRFVLYENTGGTTIGTANGKVILLDGNYFRDLEGDGVLHPYEDWHLDAKTRAKDLASRLEVDEIAGLMVFSTHQMIPSRSGEPFLNTYDGKAFEESGVPPHELSDQQKTFMDRHIRNFLVAKLESAEIGANWNNEMQAYAENKPHGIPVVFSSDPRNNVSETDAEFKVAAADMSEWPGNLGIAASFSPKLCRRYAECIAKEYRALGITVGLSPQADLGTEPRWSRIEDTFGTHPLLAAEMAQAYCDGMQTTEGAENGWGKDSVAAISKHWPGAGTGEGGRDAHYPYGKYAVYPGENADTHLLPFLDGVFHLKGKTKQTYAVMPYYSVSWGLDKKNHKNVGNAYSTYLVKDLLREKYGYDGVVCTDWIITADPEPKVDSFGSRCYGVEELTEAERHLLLLENGVDQFGGNTRIEPIQEAYRLGCEKYGEANMRARMEESAVRILTFLFSSGLFDNPFLDAEESREIVGNEEFMRMGYNAQIRSVVMLKNRHALPLETGKKAFIPVRHIREGKTFFRKEGLEYDKDPISDKDVAPFFDRVPTPEQADFAIVFVESPKCECYKEDDVEKGGNGYFPISLQYRPYTALDARSESIAAGDFREGKLDRSYRGKTTVTLNEDDLESVIRTKERMGEKPVIVCIQMHNPMVMGELEPYADAILIDFGVRKSVLFSMISGLEEPTGLLPVQLPKDMCTVERHMEDVPFDMEAYVDSEGNAYDFGFGMDFHGVISDERTINWTKDSWRKR